MCLVKMSETKIIEPFQLNNVRNQYLATLAANLVMIGYGTIAGWVTPALPKLASEETPLLSGPLTSEQISWIGSVNCVGSLFGSFSFGYIISLIGSKRAVLFLTVPCLVFWILIYFGNVYHHIFLARLIGGWASGGTQTALVLYVSEIANDNIRGRLASVTLLSRNIGTLIAYVLGATVDYGHVPYICASILIIFVIIFTMLPNTPRFYLRKGQIQNAENALKYYKGCNGTNQLEEDAIRDELDRLKSLANEQKTEEKHKAADLYDRGALKGLGIGIALVATSHFTGYFTLTSYAVMIFKKTGSPLDPYFSSITLAVALILGSLHTTCLADILGRKILILMSLMGAAVGLFSMALYRYLYLSGCDLTSYAWVPVASLSFVILVSSAGIIPLSFICSVEYLPPKIRTMGMAIISFVSDITLFVFMKFFPFLLEVIDLHGCTTIFGICCIVGTVFVTLVMRETSGQSLDDVGLNDLGKTERSQKRRLSNA